MTPAPSKQRQARRSYGQRTMVVLVMLAAVAGPPVAAAHEPYVYPARGQSAAQQDNDNYHCYRWARDQTGFDPSVGVAAAPPMSGPLRGAAGGAALGAVGGAIGGNAGKGAAIGAGVGAVIGGARRHSQQYAQASAAASGRHAYDRAFGACMSGKGYTVR